MRMTRAMVGMREDLTDPDAESRVMALYVEVWEGGEICGRGWSYRSGTLDEVTQRWLELVLRSVGERSEPLQERFFNGGAFFVDGLTEEIVLGDVGRLLFESLVEFGGVLHMWVTEMRTPSQSLSVERLAANYTRSGIEGVIRYCNRELAAMSEPIEEGTERATYRDQLLERLRCARAALVLREERGDE